MLNPNIFSPWQLADPGGENIKSGKDLCLADMNLRINADESNKSAKRRLKKGHLIL